MTNNQEILWTSFIVDKGVLKLLTTDQIKKIARGLSLNGYSKGRKDLLIDKLIDDITGMVGTPVMPSAVNNYIVATNNYNSSKGKLKSKALFEIYKCLYTSEIPEVINLTSYIMDNGGNCRIDSKGLMNYISTNVAGYGQYHSGVIARFITINQKDYKDYISNSFIKHQKNLNDPDFNEESLPSDWVNLLKVYQYQYATGTDKPPSIPGFTVGIAMIDKTFPMVTLTKEGRILSLPPYGMSFEGIEDCTILGKGEKVMESYKWDNLVTDGYMNSRKICRLISLFPEKLLFKKPTTTIFDADKNDILKTMINPSVLYEHRNKLKDDLLIRRDWMEFYIYKQLSINPSSVRVRNYHGSIIYIQDYVENYDELLEKCISEVIPRVNSLILESDSARMAKCKAYLNGDQSGKESYDSFMDTLLSRPTNNEFNRFNIEMKYLLNCGYKSLGLFLNMLFVGDMADKKEDAIPLQKTLFMNISENTLIRYLILEGYEKSRYLTKNEMIDVASKGYLEYSPFNGERLALIEKVNGYTEDIFDILNIEIDGSINYRSKPSFIRDYTGGKMKTASYVKYILDNVNSSDDIPKLCETFGMLPSFNMSYTGYFTFSMPYMWYLFGIEGVLSTKYPNKTEKEIIDEKRIIVGHEDRYDLEDRYDQISIINTFFLLPKGECNSINTTYYGYGVKGEEDVSPYHPDAYSICYGTSTQYYAYTVQQIRAGFINESNDAGSPGREPSDERSFKIYDLSKSNSFKPLVIDEVDQLVYLLRYLLDYKEFRGDEYVEDELKSTVEEIKIAKTKVVNADSEDTKLVNTLLTFHKDEIEKVRQGLLHMFYLGMRFRQWDGTPNKFPLKEDDTIRKGFDKDADTEGERGILSNIYNSMIPETKKFFGDLKLIRNSNGKIGKSDSLTFGKMWDDINTPGQKASLSIKLKHLATYHSNKTIIENIEKGIITPEGEKKIEDARSAMQGVLDKYDGVLPKVNLIGKQCIRMSSAYFVGSGYHYGILMKAFRNGEANGFDQYGVQHIM